MSPHGSYRLRQRRDAPLRISSTTPCGKVLRALVEKPKPTRKTWTKTLSLGGSLVGPLDNVAEVLAIAEATHSSGSALRDIGRTMTRAVAPDAQPIVRLRPIASIQICTRSGHRCRLRRGWRDARSIKLPSRGVMRSAARIYFHFAGLRAMGASSSLDGGLIRATARTRPSAAPISCCRSRRSARPRTCCWPPSSRVARRRSATPHVNRRSPTRCLISTGASPRHSWQI